MNYLLWLCFLWTCTIVNVLHADNNLADKVQQLTDWSSKNSLIRLNSERFKHFVRTPPRNYSMIIMLTALSPQRQCGVCKHAHDEFQVVAQSYRYSKAFSNKLFFAMVDFDEGAEVFQYLKLNSAPVFIHFPPKTKPKKGDQLDLNRRGFSADHLAKWVQDRTEIRIEIYRPPDYSGVLIGGFALAMIAGLLYLKRDSLSFLYNNLIWGIIVIGVVCYFISGQTWNLINGPPFMNPRKDATEFFANDSQMQYVAETYVVRR
ncbi:unnamed protein product [Adineta ricciae]|uniref:Magnesium transporter protein 1 n=1 Tax=Adineta ricciae TaxID=249248 RepID=A0A815NHJ5_ADIRI|nr:unnamed protein product [Adineta ricciae]